MFKEYEEGKEDQIIKQSNSRHRRDWLTIADIYHGGNYNQKFHLQNYLEFRLQDGLTKDDLFETNCYRYLRNAALISMYPYLRSQGNYKNNEDRNIFLKAQGIKAQGYLNEDETVVIYAGSEIYSKTKEFASDLLDETRQNLLDKGIIEKNTNGLQFVQDYIASSVSNAAALVLDGSRNGWDYWKDSTGMSINDSLRKKK